MTWNQTRSGQAFDLLAPDPTSIVLEDVAHALACLNRYVGHAVVPYSVAQHSVLGVRVLRAQGHPVGTQREFLLHDAHEAYVGDVASPVKRALRAIWFGYPDSDHSDPWTLLEERARLAVAARFKIPRVVSPAVKAMDLSMLVTEARDLMSPPPRPWGIPAEPLDDLRIRPWGWQHARDEFLDEASRLGVV